MLSYFGFAHGKKSENLSIYKELTKENLYVHKVMPSWSIQSLFTESTPDSAARLRTIPKQHHRRLHYQSTFGKDGQDWLEVADHLVSKSGLVQTDSVRIHCFCCHHGESMTEHHQYKPSRHVQIRKCINEWATGKKTMVEFEEDKYKEVFKTHLTNLVNFSNNPVLAPHLNIFLQELRAHAQYDVPAM
jgi:hypothetical protein